MSRFIRQAGLNFAGESSTDEDFTATRGGFELGDNVTDLGPDGSIREFYNILSARRNQARRRGVLSMFHVFFRNENDQVRTLTFRPADLNTFRTFGQRIIDARNPNIRQQGSGLLSTDGSPFLLDTERFRIISAPRRRRVEPDRQRVPRVGRAPPSGVGRRLLGADAKTFDSEIPWYYTDIYADKDGDGECLVRVVDHLCNEMGLSGLEAEESEELYGLSSPRQQIDWLKTWVEKQEFTLLVINPLVPYLDLTDVFVVEETTHQLLWNGKHWHPLVQECNLMLRDKELTILWDGELHVGVPKMEELQPGRWALDTSDVHMRFWVSFNDKNPSKFEFGALRVRNKTRREPLDLPIYRAETDELIVSVLPDTWKLRPLMDTRKLEASGQWCAPRDLDRVCHVFFDFETVPGEGAQEILLPYSVSFMKLDTNARWEQQVPLEEFEDRAEMIVGPNCAYDFVKYVR